MTTKPNQTISFGDVNPVLTIENGLLVGRRGDYSVIYQVELPEVFSLTSADYATITQSLSNGLNILSEGIAFQRLDFYNPVSPALALTGRSNAAYRDIRKLNARRVIEGKTYFVFTRLSQPNQKRTFANTLFDVLARAKVKGLFHEKHYTDQMVGNFLHEIDGLVTSLERCLDRSKALRCRKLDGEEIHRLVFEQYFSLGVTQTPANLSPDYADLKDSARVGPNLINIFSMEADGLPPAVYTSIIEGSYHKEGVSELPVSFLHDTAFNLDFPHLVNQVIYTIPQKKNFEKLVKKMKFMTGAAGGNAENTRNAENIGTFLEEFQGKSTEKLVQFHYGIVLIAPAHDDQLYRDYYNQVRSLFGNNKIRFTANTYNTLRYFFSYAPGCAAEISDDDRALCLTNHAACFGVYESNLRSATNGILFTDRKSGWPVYINMWHHPLITNKNQLIVGPSGTGKSFTLNYFIRHYLDQGEDVVVVDLGGSYARLNTLYNGLNIECSPQHPLNFNPFLLVARDPAGGYLPPTEEDTEFITLLLFTAWQSANQDSKITSEVNAVLKELIILFFDEVNHTGITPDFTGFYHFARRQFAENENYKHLSPETFNKESFLLVMRFFIKGGKGFKEGQYHYLFNVDRNPEIFHTPFVIFELEEIKNNKVLFPITYFILSQVVLNKLLKQNKKTGRRLRFLLDEVWVLFSGEYGDMSPFIEYAYRTFRKHDGSICIATQDINDIFKNPKVGAAIKENCDIKILKMQNRDKLDSICEALQLNDHNKNVLFSMTDKYKDVYIQFKDFGVVLQIDTDEYSLGLYSSDPDHKKWLREDLERTKSLPVTLENFANHFSKK